MKTKLTKQEQSFYNDLIEDERLNPNNYILGEIVYAGIIEDIDRRKEEIKEDFGPNYSRYEKFFEDSIFLFYGSRCSIIGKYGKYFWGSCEDGEIYFADTVISNTLFTMSDFASTRIQDEDGYEFMDELMKERGKNLAEYIEKYKAICNKNGYEFSLEWNEDEKSEKEFYEMLEGIDK